MRSRPRRGVRGRNERAPPPARRSLGDRFRRPRPRRTAHRRQSRARRPAPGATLAARRRAPEARSRPPPARAGSTFRSPTKASSGPRRRSAPPARHRRPTAPSASPGAPRCRVERFAAISRRRSRRARGTSPRRTPAPRTAKPSHTYAASTGWPRGAPRDRRAAARPPRGPNAQLSSFPGRRAPRFARSDAYEASTGCAQVCCVRRYRARPGSRPSRRARDLCRPIRVA